jgi:hypothetical protein
MTKRLAVIITLIASLAFITGCPSTKSEPNDTEPNNIEPIEIEPVDIEPIVIEPNDVEPTETEPDVTPPLRAVSFHDKCAAILNNYVNEKGMVNYKTLKRKRELTNLLNEFSTLDPDEYNSWPREDKIAFWINTYNVQMLKIIINNYPINPSRILSMVWGPYSIRHIKGIWTRYKFIIMDEQFTLAEIEQRFFREEFDEPRVFFALSQASLSGPPLRNEPYYGNKLYEQLDDQTRKFLSSPLAFISDRTKEKVHLSAMLESTWHGKDFIKKYGTDKKFKDQKPAVRAVLNFITKYISKQDAHFLEVGNYSVKYIKYDWTINDSSLNR